MDRARQAGAYRHHHARPAARLILAGAALWGTTACQDLTIDDSRVIAIEIAVTAPTVQAGDTVRLTARLLNAGGTIVPGAQVTWAADDTITGFTLNKNTGLVSALAPGTWKVWARFEKLQSDALTLTVTAAPSPSTIAAGNSPPDSSCLFFLTTERSRLSSRAPKSLPRAQRGGRGTCRLLAQGGMTSKRQGRQVPRFARNDVRRSTLNKGTD